MLLLILLIFSRLSHLSRFCSLCIKFPKLLIGLWLGCAKWKLCYNCQSLCAVQLWTRESQVSIYLTKEFDLYVGEISNKLVGNSCSLYCQPASLAVSCSSMQCKYSNLMIGNITAQQSGGGCNVTSCNYNGFVNGSISSTYVPFCVWNFNFKKWDTSWDISSGHEHLNSSRKAYKWQLTINFFFVVYAGCLRISNLDAQVSS